MEQVIEIFGMTLCWLTTSTVLVIFLSMLLKHYEVNEQINRTIANELSEINDTLSELMEATYSDSK